jgi:hypothetical protein
LSAASLPRRIPVGVVVERRKARSQWLDYVWRPARVLDGLPDVEPWTILSTEGETSLFYAGAAEVELYRSETDNYCRNLAAAAPSLWISLHPTGGEPPYRLADVTADPAEGEALTEPGTAIVEAVPMPASIRAAVYAFVVEYHVERPFKKRVRDRADPEALARHRPRYRKDDDRS